MAIRWPLLANFSTRVSCRSEMYDSRRSAFGAIRRVDGKQQSSADGETAGERRAVGPLGLRAMGRYLFGSVVAFALGGSALGCTSSQTSTATTASASAKCQVQVGSATTTYTADGGKGTLAIATTRDCTWSISTNANWVSVANGGGQGEASVPYTVAVNPVPASRAAEISVSDASLQLNQAGAPCRFTLNPSAGSIGPGGGPLTTQVTVLTGCAWTAATDAPWLSSSTSGTASGTIVISVAANSGGARSAHMTAGDATFTVTQGAGSAPAPTPTPTPRHTHAHADTYARTDTYADTRAHASADGPAERQRVGVVGTMPVGLVHGQFDAGVCDRVDRLFRREMQRPQERKGRDGDRDGADGSPSPGQSHRPEIMRTTHRALLIGAACLGLRASVAGAQSVSDVLTFLVTNQSVQTGNVARDRNAAQATSDTIGRAVRANLATLPAPSTSAAFLYRLNPELGTVERATQTFGPSFVERAQTAGRYQISYGLAFQYLHFDSLDGKNLRDGSLVTTANRFSDEAAPFDADRLTLNIDASVATLYRQCRHHRQAGRQRPRADGVAAGQRVARRQLSRTDIHAGHRQLPCGRPRRPDRPLEVRAVYQRRHWRCSRSRSALANRPRGRPPRRGLHVNEVLGHRIAGARPSVGVR